MADKRAYFKLDVGYMSNPKVLSVLDESPTAILLHIASIGYAAQHLTDGIVPVKALLRMTGATQEDGELLVAAGLWIDGPTGGKAEVHDYLQHQRSSAEAKGASEKAKRAASARWDAPSNASSMPLASETAMPRERGERGEREKDESGAGAPDDAPKSLALVNDERPDVDAICEHLAGAIEANGSKRPTVTTKWRSAARLMLDKDGRTPEEIHGAINWCQRDEFWRSNILSLPTLREKYDTLRLQAQRQPRGGTARQQAEQEMWDRAYARAEAREIGADR